MFHIHPQQNGFDLSITGHFLEVHVSEDDETCLYCCCDVTRGQGVKEEIESLVKQRIPEEVKEHTDWVNSYVIVEKDAGNYHSPNHIIKKKLRICLDPRDLNEALEREPYHT